MTARYAILGAWLVASAMTLGALGFLVAGWSAPVPDAFGFRGYAILLAGTFGTVGAMIGGRLPGNRIGWLFLAIALSMGLLAFVTEYVIYGALVRPGVLPAVRPLSWLETWGWVPFAGMSLTFLPLLFPNGHLASPRWRPVAWLAFGAIVLISSTLALMPGPIDNASFVDNPLTIPGLEPSVLSTLYGAGFVVLGITGMLAAASVVVRFRGSDAAQRAQLKWFAFAAAFAAVVLAGPGILFSVAPPAALGHLVKPVELLGILAFLGIPMSAGIAILRYHLYDIDRIISRSISWALVSAALVTAFAAVVLVLQALLSDFTQGQTLAVAASTLLAFALFQPLRRRIQAAVDQRFDRGRYDAQRTADGFAERVRNEVDLPRITDALLATSTATVRPAGSALWLRSSGEPSR